MEIGKIKIGDILVAPQTNPDYVPAMKKATAIVTEKGGRTSHAAIVSRELGIPAVVGAEGATRILKEGMMAVDIGTSVGYFTMLFSKLVGKTGRVISVEQGPMQFQYMSDNVKTNGYEDRVIRYNNAAWNKEEEFQLPILGYQNQKWIVKGKRVDDILKENGIEKVDLIKIDIDGAEPWALEGLENTFKNNPDVKMIIEYYPEYIKGAGGSLDKFWEILNKYFTAIRIPGEYRETYYNLFCSRKS